MSIGRNLFEDQYDRIKNVGIQPGTTASSVGSRKLDKLVRTCSIKMAADEWSKYRDTDYKNKLDKEEIPGYIPGWYDIVSGKHKSNVGGCEPDGGVFYYKGLPIIIIEAKHQGVRGNAIERWCRNASLVRMINPNVTYITFCSGEGAYEGGVIGQKLKPYHIKGFNLYTPEDNSCWLLGTEYDPMLVCTIIESVITERIRTLGLTLKPDIFS